MFNDNAPTTTANRLCHNLIVSGFVARGCFGIWAPLMNRPKAVFAFELHDTIGTAYFYVHLISCTDLTLPTNRLA